MSISSITSRACGFIHDQMPTIASPKQIVRNVSRIALPAIALAGMSMLRGAEAGPIAYAACVALCCGTFPPLIPVLLPSCAAGCAPLLALPTP